MSTVHYTVCGHCGRDITAEDYTACRWCAAPVCSDCAPQPYCPNTKELFPHPPAETDEKKPSGS